MRCTIKSQNIRTVLIKLEKITAVFIEDGEMRCHDQLLVFDLAVIGNGSAGLRLDDLGVLVNGEILCECI